MDGKNLHQFQWKKTDAQSLPAQPLSGLGVIEYGSLVSVSWLDFPEEGGSDDTRNLVVSEDGLGYSHNSKVKNQEPGHQIRVFYQDENHELVYLKVRGPGNGKIGTKEEMEVVTLMFGGGGQADEKGRGIGGEEKVWGMKEDIREQNTGEEEEGEGEDGEEDEV